MLLLLGIYVHIVYFDINDTTLITPNSCYRYWCSHQYCTFSIKNCSIIKVIPLLEYINSNSDIQAIAVQYNSSLIQYITNPTHDIQLTAVKQNGYCIKYIPNPPFEIQLAAVQQTGYAISLISNPSFEIQLAAINQTIYALSLIKNLHEDIKATYYNRINKNRYVFLSHQCN